MFVMLFPAFAMAESPFAKGTWEIGVTADSGVGLAPVFGLFVADGLELTALYSRSTVDLGASGVSFAESTTSEALSVDLLYHFRRTSQVVPFLGLGWGLLKDEVSDGIGLITPVEVSGFVLTLGMRVMLAPDRSVNLAISRLDGELEEEVTGTIQTRDVEITDYSVSYSLYF